MPNGVVHWYQGMDLRRRGRLLLCSSLMLGCLAAWVVQSRVSKLEAMVGSKVDVLVLKSPISANAEINAEMLSTRDVAIRDFFDGMVKAEDQPQIVGRTAAVDVKAGQLLQWNMIVDQQDVAMRHYTLTASQTTVFEALQAGDTIDLLVVYRVDNKDRSEVTMRNIQVVAVQGGGTEKPAVTLLVTIAQAERLAWFENFGRQVRLLRGS